MRYCRCEKRDFPSSQFVFLKERWIHLPPGGDPHLAEETPEPPPAPLRMMTFDDYSDLGISPSRQEEEHGGDEHSEEPEEKK